MITIETTKTTTYCVLAYFSRDCHSVREKRGTVFHNTLGFGNTALATWWIEVYDGFSFIYLRFQNTKERKIME